MIIHQGFQLNLASRPMRNRRFFYWLAGILALVFLGFSLVGGIVFMKYRLKTREVNRQAQRVESHFREIQVNAEKYRSRISSISSANQNQVDFINQIIAAKHFSWVKFLTTFEEILPDSCYLISLAPQNRNERGLGVNVQVAAPNLQGLLDLVTRLNEKKFRDISIYRERRAESGHFIFELVFNYD